MKTLSQSGGGLRALQGASRTPSRHAHGHCVPRQGPVQHCYTFNAANLVGFLETAYLLSMPAFPRSPAHYLRRLAEVLVLLVLVASSARAATLYWDSADATGLQSGTGAWSLSAGNWSTNASGTGARVAWSNGGDAVFSGSGATVTISGTVSVGNITFSGPGWSVAGGTIAQSGSASTITANESGIIAAALTGSATLVKSGTATLTLTSLSNAWSGSISVNQGTLELSAGDPDSICAVVIFYGTGPTDFSASKATYLGHFAEADEFESEADVNHLEESLRAAARPVTFHRYPGTGHWFFEPDRAGAYNQPAAALAWDRTLAFLMKTLP